jgi:NADH-quinone oxidoreductase subunit E
MAHIAELLDITPAEVYGTATFYEMFKFEPVGTYCINICSNISCQLLGAWELLEHAEHSLGIKTGGTTGDGMFTLEDVECIAACTEAPALQVNYRYRYRVTHAEFDQLIDDLRAGGRSDEFPPHGTLARVRQRTPQNWAGTGRAAQAEVDAR